MSLYRDKKVLVVDDFPEFRMSIRQMLLSLKIQDIHMANTGEEALRICQKHKFDIILSDYNLGEGKDGQQFLEEIREYKLLTHSAIFVLLTAENTAFMVMGALENCPDAYLTKPFTRQDLKARLDRLCAMKDELEDINYALDRSDHEGAIKACDELIKSKSKLSSHALRIKASVLVNKGDFEGAEKLFKMVIQARPVIWAQMGYAKTLFKREEYEQSNIQLDKILEQNDNYLEAYDLMAENNMAMGNTAEAQQILSKAISKSAKSPQRQHRLGKIAKANNDIDTATRALRRTVELSQNGLHQKPENVLDYVESLKDKAASDNSLSGKKAGSEALNVLTQHKKEIRKSADTNVHSKILESKIYTVQNKDQEAMKAAKEARRLQESLVESIGPSVLSELAETMLDVGEYEDAAALLSQLSDTDFSNHPDKEKIEKAMTEMLENEELLEFHNALNENNQRGVEFYDEGLLEEAVDEFREAVKAAETSISINLNLVQSLIKLMQSAEGIDKGLLAESETCFERIGSVSQDNPRYSRYSDLYKMHQGYVAKSNGEE